MDALDFLPKDLAAKMRRASDARSVKCPTCHVGRGRNCVDVRSDVHATRLATAN